MLAHIVAKGRPKSLRVERQLSGGELDVDGGSNLAQLARVSRCHPCGRTLLALDEYIAPLVGILLV